MVVEKQVIVNWYRPEEKLPPEVWDVVLCTVSGRAKFATFDHVLALMSYDKQIGWFIVENFGNDEITEFKVHAWCDLDPYKGE